MTSAEFSFQFQAQENLLRAFALKLCGSRNDADDLYQETAYKAFKNQHSFHAGTNIKSWLTTIMKNTFINGYRKKKRNHTLFDWTPTDYLVDSGSHTVINDGEINIAVEELENVIGKLNDNMGIPFRMVSKGYKYKEIAQELDLPLGTVKSRVSTARKIIQDYLEKASTHN